MIDYVQNLGGEEVMYGYLNAVSATEHIVMFPNHTVNELLFEGYEDPLISGAVAMGLPVLDRFGFFYKRNDSASVPFEIDSGEADMGRFGLLRKYNNQTELNFWKERSTCNQFNRSSTGELNPPFQLPHPAKVSLFVPDICRSVFTRLALPLPDTLPQKCNLKLFFVFPPHLSTSAQHSRPSVRRHQIAGQIKSEPIRVESRLVQLRSRTKSMLLHRKRTVSLTLFVFQFRCRLY
jgi:hypothetical protein